MASVPRFDESHGADLGACDGLPENFTDSSSWAVRPSELLSLDIPFFLLPIFLGSPLG